MGRKKAIKKSETSEKQDEQSYPTLYRLNTTDYTTGTRPMQHWHIDKIQIISLKLHYYETSGWNGWVMEMITDEHRGVALYVPLLSDAFVNDGIHKDNVVNANINMNEFLDLSVNVRISIGDLKHEHEYNIDGELVELSLEANGYYTSVGKLTEALSKEAQLLYMRTIAE